MILYKKIHDLQKRLQLLRAEGKTIGFVPTMGALHNGHMQLIETCKKNNDIAVCSIFINPVQFNDKKDYEKYPVTIDKDILLLEQNHTDILFWPPVSEIYPDGLEADFQYELGFLETILEGYYRPGHFQGVCRVMHLLLNIVQPDDLFMGQKDYQQCMVLGKLINDNAIPAKLHIEDTQREETGLAMSSRNMRLSNEGKQKATAIFQALNYIKNNISSGDVDQLKATAKQMLISAGFEKIDYIEICDAISLEPAKKIDPSKKYVALAAAFLEGVRLIDNIIIDVA